MGERIGRKDGGNRGRGEGAASSRDTTEVIISPESWAKIQGALDVANHPPGETLIGRGRLRGAALVNANYFLVRSGALGIAQVGRREDDNTLGIVGTRDWEVTEVKIFDGDPPYPGDHCLIKARRRSPQD